MPVRMAPHRSAPVLSTMLNLGGTNHLSGQHPHRSAPVLAMRPQSQAAFFIQVAGHPGVHRRPMLAG